MKIIFSVMVLFYAQLVLAEDAQTLNSGELLYKEECQRCHDSSLVPISDGTSLKSLDDLRWQISTCVSSLRIFWTPKDEEDVAVYLNHNFYHFENTSKPAQ